jgi:hypothetical protein
LDDYHEVPVVHMFPETIDLALRSAAWESRTFVASASGTATVEQSRP